MGMHEPIPRTISKTEFLVSPPGPVMRIRICGSGFVSRIRIRMEGYEPDPDPGHRYTVNVQKHAIAKIEIL